MNTSFNSAELNFEKLQGLIPVCVQDQDSLEVLMIGFMNQEALARTLELGQVTFYSRTKGRLWTKGESSGHFLKVVEILQDCDKDSLLILVKRSGPVCHTGDISCFGKVSAMPDWYWLSYLTQIIEERKRSGESGYTNDLLKSGLPRIAQKVGEEAVEVVIAALSDSIEDFTGEAVDLLYHLFVLLEAKQVSINNIALKIKERARGAKK